MAGKKTRKIFRILTFTIVAGLIAAGGIFLYLVYLYNILPDPAILETVNPQTTSFIRRECVKKPCTIDWVSLEKISPFLPEAILLAEDPRFFVHHGIDWQNIRSAILANWESGEIVWGGSSITMQLAKNLYLSPEKSVGRKLREIVLTYKLERSLSKKRILEIYLNVAEWGPDIFGVEKASEYYFRKKPVDLTPLEAAFLATILPNPAIVSEGLPERFMEAGSMVFESLLNFYLPQYGDGEAADCAVRLSIEEAAQVDYIVAKIFNKIAPEIRTGRAMLYTKKELADMLTEDEWGFVEGLLKSVGEERKIVSLDCNRTLDMGKMTEFIQEDSLRNKRVFWITAASVSDLNRLLEDAAEKKVFLKLNSAYRGEGFQIFTLLKQLRQDNYCLSDTIRLVALPEESEYTCTDRQAIDLGDAVSGGAVQEGSRAFDWLEKNAATYNFSLSYPEKDDSEFIFEPWHWSHSDR